MTDEKESISEVELIGRWKMHSTTFFFKKQNHQTPPCFLHNMTTRYFLKDVEEYEAKNRIVVAS